ncbi:MAG: O-antigen ligase family protein [Candidatus Krumholzibacteriota bacterium]|nr:O-antigen ligase family protein [Candidatus Krumholzibacteriota bacterium]
MSNRVIIPALAAILALATILMLLASVKVALAAFGAMLVAVLVFFKPFWGLLAYLAMVYLRPQEFVPALQGMPIMLAISLLVLGVFILHTIIQRRPFTGFRLRQSVFMLVFFIIIPLSQLQRFYLFGAKEAFSSFLPVFILFFMIIALVGSFDQLRTVFTMLFVMTLMLAVNGIFQYYNGTDIAGQTPIEGNRIRWIGIFADPNDLGLALLTFTPFALVKMTRPAISAVWRLAWAPAFVVLVYALYLTNSRGTALGLIVVFVVFLVRRLGAWKGLLIGLLVAAAMFAAGPSRLADVSPEEASASGRIDAWATGLNLFFWRPILGIGYNSFTEYHHLTAHNSVVLCMAELGLAGLFVWLLMIFTSFDEMRSLLRRAPGTRYGVYAEAMLLSIAGFFAAAFFLSRTYNSVLYVVIAVSALLSRFASEEHGFTIAFLDRRTAIAVSALTVGLVGLVKVLVML